MQPVHLQFKKCCNSYRGTKGVYKVGLQKQIPLSSGFTVVIAECYSSLDKSKFECVLGGIFYPLPNQDQALKVCNYMCEQQSNHLNYHYSVHEVINVEFDGQHGTLLLMKSARSGNLSPNESFLEFKVFLNYLLPFCGMRIEVINKREELSNMTQMQTMHKTYQDSDFIGDEDGCTELSTMLVSKPAH